ncbi:MAG: aldehyde dehydrogenase family protein [Methanomicrobiales archaeon]|nr:aldehyde dehydrogenase family protein [Methanomicrobiales archaeon]
MQMRIGGLESASSDDRWIRITNPATREEVDWVPAGTEEDVQWAVDTAETAFEGWRETPARERGKILFRAAGLVREIHSSLAPLLTREQGKPLREAIDELRGFANILEFYGGISASLQGDFISLGKSGECVVHYQPLGVCGAIIPWNMPAIVMGWKIAPALLAGNTMVMKPSSTAPLTSLHLARLLEEAGIPSGVLNVVTGGGEEVGSPLVRHPKIQKLSFTGSTETGAQVLALSREIKKEIVLELGGSDPMIVWKDADLEAAVAGAVRGRFYNAGQTCNAVKRLYLHEEIASQFLQALVPRIQALIVGNGLDPQVEMGPLHTATGREKTVRQVQQVIEGGEGKILVGGEVPQGSEFEQGFFYQPTLISDVAEDSLLFTEEMFGPVLPVRTFSTLDEVIGMANHSKFGLGASIWTQNLTIARSVFRRVDAGVVWVNRHLTVPPEVPFGGVKESGLGRENGVQAIRHYTRTKSFFVAD